MKGIHVKNIVGERVTTLFLSSSPHKNPTTFSSRPRVLHVFQGQYREYSRENYPFDLDPFPSSPPLMVFFLVEARNDNCYQEGGGRRRSRQPPFSPSFPAIYSLLICFCFFVKTLNPSSFESLTTTATRVPSFPASRVSRETIHLTFRPRSLFNLFSLSLSSILV